MTGLAPITHGGGFFAPTSACRPLSCGQRSGRGRGLYCFDPSTGQRLNRIVGPLNVFGPHPAINSRNEVYLAVADTKTPPPGLRIFDAVTDREITTTPLNVGQLPPLFTLFLE